MRRARARATASCTIEAATAISSTFWFWLSRLARLVVPQLADWTLITVIEEDGRLRDLGLAHHDPRRYDDLAAYYARHLEEMTETAAVRRALHGAEPVVVPRLLPEILPQSSPTRPRRL